MPGARPVQISAPPLARKMTAVAMVSEILPVLPLGEFQQTPGITVDDLAVTSDARRLWLVSRSDGRPVEPMLFTAVNLRDGQQPLTRFLTEIWTAFCAPCRPFSWGPLAGELPFLPRIRHGRSILHSARWVIIAAQLPNPDAPLSTWLTAWEQLREPYKIPSAVFLGADDRRIRLDLDEPAHLALLRNHLHRRPKAILTETSDQAGWIGGRAHGVCLTLARTQSPSSERVRPARAAGTVEHRSGLSPWLYARLFGRCDDILAQAWELDDLIGEGWWFIRYHEPKPHLRVRIPLREPDGFGPTAERLGCWADSLAADGLLHDYTLNTYRPEARFGTGATLAAAETVFAADSHLVVRRLSGDREITTAAGLIRIATGFTASGPEWLIEHVDHRGQTPADQRPIGARRKQVLRALRDVDDDRLQHALADYRDHADRDGLDPDPLLADLLHLHHARMIGVDSASERYCLRQIGRAHV